MEDIEDMDVEMIMTNKRNDERPNAHAVRCSRTVWAGRALGDSFIPGISIYLLSRSSLKVYISTWGCSHNNSDSEYMAGLLSSAGYAVTSINLSKLPQETAIKCSDQREDADVWILNSCTVKTPSEHHLRNMVISGTEKSKKIIVAGCVPQAQPNIPWLNGVSLLGVHNIDRVVEVLEETAKGNVIHLLTRRTSRSGLSRNVPLLLPKIRRNSLVELLPISSGCLNKCTYCKTKQARGNLVSYSVEEIVARAKTAFQEGVKEIWLTSEDLGAYGRDIDVTLPDLLNDLVAVIPDGCMLRLGMTNPPYILDYLEVS
ncbi:Putative cdk5 regulatory subunit associated prote in 1-like 1 [Trichuris trichiura]|uniref:Putative cdk5 regulatory subunit associated prote in 1-like 1 n=1 Tax=Trichuris trichiura TaxID=36087 RepID=A0A077ZL18_TRITR|nr:Putative cdk5 regulatory subunit associated prote in 1-like 1 [Trichuris trichiura]